MGTFPGWPESVKSMQRNWIGRSRGVQVDFSVSDSTNSDDSFKGVHDPTRHVVRLTYLAIKLGTSDLKICDKLLQENSEVAKFIRECQSNSTAEANFYVLGKKGYCLWIVCDTSID